MLGFQVSKQRFSLYHLDEGEMFIKDYLGSMNYYYPPKKTFLNLNGIIYLGSRSLFFEPEDKNYALIRFPFKNFVYLPYLTPKDSSLNFSTTRIIEIDGNFTEPYIIMDFPEKDVEHHKVSITVKFERVEIVSKIISQLIEKYNSKESCFEFDSLDYLGTLYSFKFDVTLIKSVKEKIIYENELYVKQQLPLIEVPGILRVTDLRIYFQPLFKIGSKKSIKVKFSSMTQLFKRRLHLKNIGIEIVTPKKSLLLEFENQPIRDTMYNLFFEQKPENCETDISIEEFTRKWVQGDITNYDYLIKLNNAANRTRNNLSQYPIFPWIILNFDSEILDLTNEKNFRDLSKPIGALNPARLNDYLNRFKDMPEPKFIYGTHYSTSAYVIGYLCRKYPEYMLKLHSGRFDNPDRVFNSIQTDWNINYINAGSIKELIPEFYEDNPDFLLNDKHINLGVTAKGQKLDKIILPIWAENNPRIFLDTMKKALESDYVNKHLHEWIDLIFGYKQRGEEAIKANNLFHPVSYEDGSNFKDKSEDEIRMIQVQATEFGQCPTQLFKHPHPQRFTKYMPPSLNLKFDEDKLNLISISKEKRGSKSNFEDKPFNTHHNIKRNEDHLSGKKFVFDSINFTQLKKHHRE